MKVLFSGYKNPHFMAVTDYIELALRDLGHDVRYFDYRSYAVPGRLRDAFPPLEDWDRRRLNRRLASIAADFRPDLFLACGGYTIEPDTVRTIRRSGSIAAAWYADYPLLFERYARLAPHYDRFFTSGTDALERHAAAGNTRGHWLPFACLPDLHRPVSLSEDERARYGADLSMVGTAYPERVRLFEGLLDFRPALWGPGWDRLPKGHALIPYVQGGSLPTAEWLKVASASRISVNLMGSYNSPLSPDAVSMINSRCFELLGCGAFQLVEAKKDVKALFRSGEELAWFSSVGEARERVRHYLDHEEERVRIARRGREAALARHTYRHRLAELLEKCGR